MVRTDQSTGRFWADLKGLLSITELWLAAFCILCGYQLFWATYSFSGYLQKSYGMTAVAVGTITVAKLWMRPVGAIAAGFVGDRFNLEKVLAALMLAGSIALAALIILPLTVSTGILLTVVLLVGLLTYAIRGIYWATLDSCNITVRIKGLAIGVISLIGYSPDIYLPLINGAVVGEISRQARLHYLFHGDRVDGAVGYIVCLATERNSLQASDLD